MTDLTDTIELWHGAHRWDPPPEIRAPKNGNAEYGAGIYATTHYMTARKYALGGGSVMSLKLNGNLRLLEGVETDVQELMEVARGIPRLKNKDKILSDLDRRAARSRDGKTIGLDTLLNLAVNNNSMIGAPAVAITEHLVSKGIDASLNERSGNEDWLVVFNPKIIISAKARPAASIGLDEYERLKVKDQLKFHNDFRITRAQDALKVLEDVGKTNLKPFFQ